MPVPNLIRPVNVIFELLDRDAFMYDLDAREPIHGSRSSQTTTLPAQVYWAERDRLDARPAGVREVDRGEVVVRFADMDKQGIRLKRGDRITSIGNQTGLDLYLTEEQPIAHWADIGGPGAAKFAFVDRHPVRQEGDL